MINVFALKTIYNIPSKNCTRNWLITVALLLRDGISVFRDRITNWKMSGTWEHFVYFENIIVINFKQRRLSKPFTKFHVTWEIQLVHFASECFRIPKYSEHKA